MAKRHGISKGSSRKMFTANAVKTKTMNTKPPVMRGGIRL